MQESESLLWNWELYTVQTLGRLSMNTVPPDRAKILRRAIAPVLSDFIKSSETAAADFHVVEIAAAIAIGQLRKLLMTAGLTAAAEDTPSFHCPKCSRLPGCMETSASDHRDCRGRGLLSSRTISICSRLCLIYIRWWDGIAAPPQ